MDEKTMVTDTLVGINGELKMFAEYITQTENKELKQCLKQMRNQSEMSQEKLYQVVLIQVHYINQKDFLEQLEILKMQEA